jgi:hypothetical protein
MTKANSKQRARTSTMTRIKNHDRQNLDRIRLDARGALAAATTSQLALQNNPAYEQVATVLMRHVIIPLSYILELSEAVGQQQRHARAK